MKRLVEDAIKAPVDVRSLLLRFFQERSANDYTWTRPNVRHIQRGMYLPSLRDNSLGEVAIMVDTSGSIDELALAKARGIVQDVLDECKPSGVTLYFSDARVANVTQLEKGEPLTWEPQGGGGTDFRPALAQIEADGEPVCVVCITDLDGTFPDVPPSLPILWLSTEERDWRGNLKEAPFGETVYVGE